MGKLGYTWYPKDWGNSESVFELTLSERGLYRELIDLAMLNDNQTEIKFEVWCRKFFIEKTELTVIINKLSALKLIQINGEKLFIPSCESRLNLVRGGRNGGKKNKPTPKPTPKPFGSLNEKNDKPTPKQIEIETKIEKESKLNQPENSKENFLRVGTQTYKISPSEYYKQNLAQSFEVWQMNNKTDLVFLEKTFKTMDSEYTGYDFSDDNHVRRTFLFVLGKVKKIPIEQTVKAPVFKRKHFRE